MTDTSTAGVYMLDAEHTSAMQRFVSDPAFATMIGLDGTPSSTAGADFVARAIAERLAGTAYWNAIVDRGEAKGVSALVAPYSSEPRLVVWIDPACRRRGYGRLAARLGLELAFRNLQLAHVHATGDSTDPAQQALLRRFGFAAAQHEGEYDLTRDGWVTHRDPRGHHLHGA